MKGMLALLIALAITGCEDRSAAQIAEDMAQEKIDMIKSAGNVVKKEGQETSDTVAQGVGNIIKGFSTGFDKSLVSKDVRMSESIDPALLVITRSQRIESSSKDPAEGLSLYLSSTNGFSGHVRLVAMSPEGEVGRSNAEIKIEKDSASYIDFEFDKRTPFSIVSYYKLEEMAK